MENNAIPNKEAYQLKDIETLKPHPKNYKKHPEDQLKHICRSIEENGIYRNIIISNDDVILAGHGVVQACKKLNIKSVPTLKLDISSTDQKATKLLTADNEVSHLGEVDERALSDVLKDILDNTGDLLGTGYDEMMLSNLLFVTRPNSEVKDFDEAAEWVGMPEYEAKEDNPKWIINFRTKEEREDFKKLINCDGGKMEGKTWSTWFPPRENEDLKSVKYENEE